MGCLTQYVYAANSKGNCVSECNVVYDMVMKDLVIPPQDAFIQCEYRKSYL